MWDACQACFSIFKINSSKSISSTSWRMIVLSKTRVSSPESDSQSSSSDIGWRSSSSAWVQWLTKKPKIWRRIKIGRLNIEGLTTPKQLSEEFTKYMILFSKPYFFGRFDRPKFKFWYCCGIGKEKIYNNLFGGLSWLEAWITLFMRNTVGFLSAWWERSLSGLRFQFCCWSWFSISQRALKAESSVGRLHFWRVR